MSRKYDEYLKTDYWKQVTMAVKKRADFRCQLCNSQHDLCAHHRTYDHRGQELNYLNDLVCLCRRCHEIFHGKGKPEEEQKPWALMSRRQRREAINKARMEKSEIPTATVENDMPPGDGPITLTKELIERCRTAVGGFTNATLIPLGVPPKPKKGWTFELRGKVISRAEYRQALEGRYVFGLKR